jgi:hypothetical protein
MDFPQKDLLDCLLLLQIHGPLDEKLSRKLEHLQRLQSGGMIDEQVIMSATFDGPVFNGDHQNPPSSLAYNSHQNQLASYGIFNDPSLNHFQTPHSNPAYTNDQIESASFPFETPTSKNLNQDQSEQRQPFRNSLTVSTPDAAHAHAQRSVIIAATPGSPPPDDSAHADAEAIVPRANSALPPAGLNGLRFDSFEAASAATDLLFRAPVKIHDPTDDDVSEVEQRKRLHVKSLTEALKHHGFMPPPDEWRGERNKTAPLTKENKEDFTTWQEDEREKVRAWMKMPTIDVKLECVAWEIFEEILKVHRTGAIFSNKSTGRTRKCSERVQEAVETLRDWANVRLKAIKFDKIPNFAANPQGYAHVTYTNRRCNSKRLSKKQQEAADRKADGSAAVGEADEIGKGGEAGKPVEASKKSSTVGATATDGKKSSRGASENGAIAHQCMPPVEVRKRKRAAEAAKASVTGQQGKGDVAKTKVKPIQALPSSVNEHGSAFAGEVTPMVPTPFPTGRPHHYSGSPRTEPTQPARYGTMAPPPSPSNNDYSLAGSFRSSNLIPAGVPGFNANDLAAGTYLTFGNSTGNNPHINNNSHNSYGSGQTLYGDPTLYSSQTLLGTQNQRHRQGEAHHEGCPAAAFDAAAPGVKPAQPSPVQGGMPGGSANKRQRRT